MTLGELNVEEKNEIIAVPELLDLIDVEGAIVTADAMRRQKKIVEKNYKEKANYTIGLKQNQSALYQDTEDYFNEFARNLLYEITYDKGHGRIEKESIDF